MIDQQDVPAGANALAVGGVNGHRSKWSAAIGLGSAWPPDRSRTLPTSWLGGDRLRPPINRAADVHGGAVSAGRGTRWVSCGYLTAQILAFLAARFGLRSAGAAHGRVHAQTPDTAEAVAWRTSPKTNYLIDHRAEYGCHPLPVSHGSRRRRKPILDPTLAARGKRAQICTKSTSVNQHRDRLLRRTGMP